MELFNRSKNEIDNSKDNLETIVIPEGTLSISDRAFYRNKKLKNVYLPDSVKDIGILAFFECTSLEKIHLPNSLQNIGDGAFDGCSSLKEIHLPESLRNVGKDLFCRCELLEEIHLPDSLQNIGNNMFRGCSSLKKIHLPDSLQNIGAGAFMNCSSLTEIHLPNSLKYIGNNVFCLCTSLNEISLPASCEYEYIRKNVFIGCNENILINYEHIFSLCKSAEKKQLGINILRKGSETGDASAQYYFGLCYYQGVGVVKSTIKAREWMEEAIKQNFDDALIFAEEHPDLFSSIKKVYNVSGDLIQDNHGIIAKDDAIVSKSGVIPAADKPRFCPKCGKPADEDAKFCKYCGRKLI